MCTVFIYMCVCVCMWRLSYIIHMGWESMMMMISREYAHTHKHRERNFQVFWHCKIISWCEKNRQSFKKKRGKWMNERWRCKFIVRERIKSNEKMTVDIDRNIVETSKIGIEAKFFSVSFCFIFVPIETRCCFCCCWRRWWWKKFI